MSGLFGGGKVAKTDSQIKAEKLTAKRGREESYEKSARLKMSQDRRSGKSLLLSGDSRGISDTLGG